MLEERWSLPTSVCVGLDTDYRQIPTICHIRGSSSVEQTLVRFNRAIIEATHDLVCAYKINVAFYEAYGPDGIYALIRTIEHINTCAPQVPVILDAKRADIGNTNFGYITSAFDIFNADAITVSPYLGQEALQPFLDCKSKGIIVLCRTSNPGAGESFKACRYDLLFQNICMWR